MSSKSPSPARAKSNRPRLAIIGAGMGGLALALALRKRGMDATIIERRSAEQIRDDGLFLTLAPNGLNALRGLGIADNVCAAGLSTTGLAIFNERGKKLGLIDYSAHAAEFGAPSSTIRRGALGSILLDAVLKAGLDLRCGTKLEMVSESADAVTIHTNAGTETFDTVIAADGLRSEVRRSIFPELPGPRYSGLIGTGGVTDVPNVAPTNGIMNMTFGRRAFFGYLKQEGGPVLWFNSYPASETETGQIADPRAYARRVAELHDGDPLDNSRILAAVESIGRNYPVYDMDELTRWSTPRVLLMGDAAHAVAPHSGQGASMAIEDALVLAACLNENSLPRTAFQRFEGLRRSRVARAIAIGRQSGSQKHAQSWLSLRIRDLILPLVLPLGRKTQESMFGFRADLTPLAQP